MEEQIVIQKTERPNSISFRIGGVGTDCKIYFSTAEDLEQQLLAINERIELINGNITHIKSKWSNG